MMDEDEDGRARARVDLIQEIERLIEDLRELFGDLHPTADDELMRIRGECKELRRWLRDDFDVADFRD